MKKDLLQKEQCRGEDQFVAAVDAALSRLAPELETGRATVLVAFSGGPDSCALLSAVKQIGERRKNINICACHVNHGLRGADSDADEQFCVQLCKLWKIPIAVCKLGNSACDENSLRDARYASLLAEAERVQARWIITGHTRDDQVETVLFRLFRGSAAGGLLGIPARRSLTATTAVVRPMLELSRDNVLAFLDRMQIVGRQDASNQAAEYSRNYIRLEIVPRISERFPRYADAIERFRKSLAEDGAVLDALANDALASVAAEENTFCSKPLSALPLAVQRRILADALRSRQIQVTQERISDLVRLLHNSRGRMSLNAHWDAQTGGERFTFINKETSGDDANQESCAQLIVPGITPMPDWGVYLHAEAFSGEVTEFPPASANEAYVDLSRIVPPLVVRARKPGDTIQPFGMEQSVKLKKYLHTHKTRGALNPLGLLVIADCREVVWIPGVGLSEKVKVIQTVSHCLRLLPIADDL